MKEEGTAGGFFVHDNEYITLNDLAERIRKILRICIEAGMLTEAEGLEGYTGLVEEALKKAQNVKKVESKTEQVSEEIKKLAADAWRAGGLFENEDERAKFLNIEQRIKKEVTEQINSNQITPTEGANIYPTLVQKAWKEHRYGVGLEQKGGIKIEQLQGDIGGETSETNEETQKVSDFRNLVFKSGQSKSSSSSLNDLAESIRKMLQIGIEVGLLTKAEGLEGYIGLVEKALKKAQNVKKVGGKTEQVSEEIKKLAADAWRAGGLFENEDERAKFLNIEQRIKKEVTEQINSNKITPTEGANIYPTLVQKAWKEHKYDVGLEQKGGAIKIEPHKGDMGNKTFKTNKEIKKQEVSSYQDLISKSRQNKSSSSQIKH